MKRLLASAAALLLLSGLAEAQDASGPFARAASDVRGKTGGASGPQGESLDSIKQLPDWGGLWQGKMGGARGSAPEPPQFTPPYAARLKAFNDAKTRGENVQSAHANCMPFAFPSSMGIYPFEFLMTPGKVTVAIETDSQMRRIFTDGRKLPDDPDLSFQGYSVGHWEGDTLVVKTRGLVPSPQMEIMEGVGHSDKLVIDETIRLVGPDALEIKWTYDDPVVLAKPWTQTRVFYRHRDWDLEEYNCAQNNHDAADDKGRPSMHF
jgi:hypothetical protein